MSEVFDPGDAETTRCAVEKLIGSVLDLKEEQCLTQMREMLEQGMNPMTILEGCIEGMRRVGSLFERGEYFIAALIMAGEIMREATDLLRPHLSREPVGRITGRVLLGTIQGDIHDLGKNLFALLLRSHGFVVEDLGVDVAPETFLAKAKETSPDLLAISCVLTSGLEKLKELVALLHAEPPGTRPPILIGGACIDEQIAQFLQADLWAADAAQGLRICRQLIEKKKTAEPSSQPSMESA